MITLNTAEELLARKSKGEPRGTLIHHEIGKMAGTVTRRRQYSVYLPDGYTPERMYPLIMVLHGCRQDHMAIRAIAGFDAIADRVGAIVVYPFVTSYSGLRTQNCWGWWLTGQRQRGRGEVADLCRIAEDVAVNYSVNPQRRHICGLSAGGAMSVASLAAYSDFWASGASVAGVPYGESSRSVSINPHVPVRLKSVATLTRMLSRALITPAPPLLILQSKADMTVSAELGENLKHSWVAASGIDTPPTDTFSDMTNGIAWQFEQFCSDEALQVGHFLMNDLAHGWPGGLAGKYSIPDAPNGSELIWEFFEHCANSADRQSADTMLAAS